MRPQFSKRKTSRKLTSKKSSKSSNCKGIKTYFPRSLFFLNGQLLMKKYVHKYANNQIIVTINQLIEDENKVYQEMRIETDQKEYLLLKYSNPMMVLNKKIYKQSLKTSDRVLGCHIRGQEEIYKILASYKTRKNRLSSAGHRKRHIVKNEGRHKKSFQTKCQNSSLQLQSLICNLGDMIKNSQNAKNSKNNFQTQEMLKTIRGEKDKNLVSFPQSSIKRNPNSRKNTFLQRIQKSNQNAKSKKTLSKKSFLFKPKSKPDDTKIRRPLNEVKQKDKEKRKDIMKVRSQRLTIKFLESGSKSKENKNRTSKKREKSNGKLNFF